MKMTCFAKKYESNVKNFSKEDIEMTNKHTERCVITIIA